MDLILKISSACNFKCTFCSSTAIADNAHDEVDIQQVFRFLERYPDTRTIIVNGGDPLMVQPKYYWELIDYLDAKELPTSISFTSNLWPFYVKPEKWQDLFRHPRMGVATSFQYGNARLKHDLTPYTEAEFWKVSDLMLERIGYRPTFIAVITEENEDSVLQTVELARKMGVVCKVNYAFGSGEVVNYKTIQMGNRHKPYVLAKIYEHYLAIHAAGLTEWEHNTQQMLQAIQGRHTICPLAKRCDEGIRAIQPSGRYFSCGAFGDDNEYAIDFEAEMAGAFFTPLQDAPELRVLKESCYSCPMFEICNGCHKTIAELKETQQVEVHCQHMKALAPRILAAAGVEAELTSYVREYPDTPTPARVIPIRVESIKRRE